MLYEFLGRLHPILVHLPIGFLIIGLLLQLLCNYKRYEPASVIIPIVLLIGAASALFSCFTGYMLSIGNDYDAKLVNLHMWMGIGVAIVSILLYFKETGRKFPVNKKVLSIGLLLLLMITGHLGGSLTHGSDYLTAPLKNVFESTTSDTASLAPIANVQQAAVYPDVITPILKSKCYSCHSSDKIKGGLQLDQLGLLMKGGKNGKAIIPNDAASSELIKRLLLPSDDEHHMPPKEKPQLTESEILLLQWWINNNAHPTQKVMEMPQPENIKPVLIALQSSPVKIKSSISYIPKEPVGVADQKIIDNLRMRDIIVIPIMQNSNYLSINFVTARKVSSSDLELLTKLKSQLIWLNLDNTNITDQALKQISQLTQLTKLHLSNTLITDQGLGVLKNNKNLQYLNLVGTKITFNGLKELSGLKTLQSLYIYKTAFDTEDWGSLKNVFPKTNIDTGFYKVSLPTNTIKL